MTKVLTAKGHSESSNQANGMNGEAGHDEVILQASTRSVVF